MKFRGKIDLLAFESTLSESHIIPPFTFSKKRIWFSSKHKDKYYTNPFLTYFIQNESDYTFSREYDKNEKKRFVITYAGGKNASYLNLNRLNRIKCNIIHHRYWVQKPEVYTKIFIGIVVGVVVGLILLLF